MENGVFTDYGYDAPTGFLDSVTYPTSTSAYRLKLKYNYQNGLLSSVADFAVPSTVFWARNTTNAWGQVTQQTFGNGLITNRVFDAVSGTLKTLQTGTTPNPTLRQNLGYLWNKVGSLTQRQDNNQGLTESFYYDNLHRLDYSTLKVGAGTPTTNLDMAYDAMGNITLKSDRSASTYAYHATKKHQVTAVGTLAYTYDNNGNMATRETPANTITWSSANLPLVITNSGTTNTFSYGPNRDRWRLVYVNGATTETTIYIGGLLEKWTRGTLTEWRHTIYAGNQPVALYTRQSGSASANLTRYFHLDHLGSIETVTDSTNAVYVRERFTGYGQRGDPATWGLPLPSGDATLIGNLSRRGYTFHESLGGATLNHMNGRVQDPILGRFLSADPYVPEPGLTQAFNRYSYVYNNPLSYTDPSGFGGPAIVVTWGCAEPHLCGVAVGVGLVVFGGEEILEGAGDVLRGIGKVFKKIFGGLFGGGGRPKPPKGCFVTNPTACTGVPGATRTPGFNPMLGLGGPSATVPGQATMTARGSSRVCTSWETCRDWILRNINRPDFNPRGSQNKTDLAIRTAAFLRVATQELGKEIGISIVIDPRTSRYYLDPRTLIIGDSKPLDPKNNLYSTTIAAGWYGAKPNLNTYVGDIHSHPDNDFGVHEFDRAGADERKRLFGRQGSEDFDTYVVTGYGVVCRYRPGQGTEQVSGHPGMRPLGTEEHDPGC